MSERPVHTSLALVVHGIGEQKRGADLKVIIEGFLPLIRNRLDETVELSAKPLDDSGAASVSFLFRHPATEDISLPPGFYDPHILKLIEVWWAASFGAPALGSLLLGSVRALRQKLSERGRHELTLFSFLRMAVWTAVWRFLSNVVLIVVAGILMVPGLVLAIAAGVDWLARRALGRDPPEQPTMLGSLHERILEFIAKGQTLIVESAVMLASPFLVMILLVLWALQLVPPNLLNDQLSKAHRAIINLLTRHFGDMWLYLYVPWEASRIRMRFEDQFREMCKDIMETGSARVDAVMVIAHSMGSVVAYEALSGPHLRPLIESTFGGEGQPRIYFLSIGSALNLAWDVAPREEVHRFDRPLPSRIDWLNLWTDYDPVPGGQLRPADRTWAGRTSSMQSGMTVPQVQREVVNQMDLLSDHSAYWNNAEQVLAPMLNMLSNQTFLSRLEMDVPRRRHRVRTLSALKGFAWMAGPLAFVIVLAGPSEIGNSLGIVAEGINWGVSLFSFVTGSIAWLAIRSADVLAWVVANTLGDGVKNTMTKAWGGFWDVQSRLVRPHGEPLKAAAWAVEIGVIAILIYSSLVKWAWDSWDQATKYATPKRR